MLQNIELIKFSLEIWTKTVVSNPELYFIVTHYSSIAYHTKRILLRILSILKQTKKNLHVKVFYHLVKITIKLFTLYLFIL